MEVGPDNSSNSVQTDATIVTLTPTMDYGVGLCQSRGGHVPRGRSLGTSLRSARQGCRVPHCKMHWTRPSPPRKRPIRAWSNELEADTGGFPSKWAGPFTEFNGNDWKGLGQPWLLVGDFSTPMSWCP